MVHEELQLRMYSFGRSAEDKGLTVRYILPLDTLENRGKIWDERLLRLTLTLVWCVRQHIGLMVHV